MTATRALPVWAPRRSELRRPLVTTKTKTHQGGETGVAPFGARHTRDVGGYLTQCGVYAWDWPIFWEFPFDPADTQSCPSCAAAVRAKASRMHP